MDNFQSYNHNNHTYLVIVLIKIFISLIFLKKCFLPALTIKMYVSGRIPASKFLLDKVEIALTKTFTFFSTKMAV